MGAEYNTQPKNCRSSYSSVLRVGASLLGLRCAMNDEFSTKLHAEKDAIHGLMPVLKCYLQRQFIKALQKVFIVHSHVPVAPSERLVLCGLSLFSHIFVMNSEGTVSQAEALSSIYTCPTPARETWAGVTAEPHSSPCPRGLAPTTPGRQKALKWLQCHGHP